jgi:hypothetical protein
MGLVAQTVQSSIVITGEQWIARTPPKRQVEGSNPSEPAMMSLLFSGFHNKKVKTKDFGPRSNRDGPVVTVYLCHEGTNDQG